MDAQTPLGDSNEWMPPGGELPAGGAPAQSGPPCPTLLFVDDDTYMRRLMAVRFEHLGAQVEAVANAQAALAYLESNRPDLIISDAVMPTMDGFDLCRRIKIDPLLQSIPVVILTALNRDLRQRSLDAGADDYLSKLEHEVVFRMRARLAMELGLRAAESGPDPVGPASLLVVSESKHIQTQLNTLLQKEGIEVRQALSLAAALGQIQENPPDGMALDLALSPQNAQDLLDWFVQVRRSPGCRDLAILALTGKDEDGQLASLEYQIQDRLQKPLDGHESTHRLKLLLRIARMPASRS